jgi:hypothetical protein
MSTEENPRSEADTTERVVSPPREVVVERTVEREPVKSGWFRPFLAGFVTAVVAAAIALGVFLVVSDSDDDGTIDVEVPEVDVDTGG